MAFNFSSQVWNGSEVGGNEGSSPPKIEEKRFTRPFTNRRKLKISRFVERTRSRYSFEDTATVEWQTELLSFMKESPRRDVRVGDVAKWVVQHPQFFRKAFQSTSPVEEDSSSESDSSVSSAPPSSDVSSLASPSSSNQLRSLQLASPSPAQCASFSPQGGQQWREGSQQQIGQLDNPTRPWPPQVLPVTSQDGERLILLNPSALMNTWTNSGTSLNRNVSVSCHVPRWPYMQSPPILPSTSRNIPQSPLQRIPGQTFPQQNRFSTVSKSGILSGSIEESLQQLARHPEMIPANQESLNCIMEMFLGVLKESLQKGTVAPELNPEYGKVLKSLVSLTRLTTSGGQTSSDRNNLYRI